MSATEGGQQPAAKSPASDQAKLREQLLAQHQSNKDQKFKEIDIPGQHGLLVARYHRVEWEISEQAAQTIGGGESGAVLNAMLDLMIAACDEILVRRESGDLIPVAAVFPELGDGPTRYTAQLAGLFNKGMEFEEGEQFARANVLALFPSEQSVAPHAQQLQRWLDFNEPGQSERFSKR